MEGHALWACVPLESHVSDLKVRDRVDECCFTFVDSTRLS